VTEDTTGNLERADTVRTGVHPTAADRPQIGDQAESTGQKERA
jgi:hypothetical protein